MTEHALGRHPRRDIEHRLTGWRRLGEGRFGKYPPAEKRHWVYVRLWLAARSQVLTVRLRSREPCAPAASRRGHSPIRIHFPSRSAARRNEERVAQWLLVRVASISDVPTPVVERLGVERNRGGLSAENLVGLAVPRQTSVMRGVGFCQSRNFNHVAIFARLREHSQTVRDVLIKINCLFRSEPQLQDS